VPKNYKFKETQGNIDYYSLCTKTIQWKQGKRDKGHPKECKGLNEKKDYDKQIQSSEVAVTFRRDPGLVKEYVASHSRETASLICIDLMKMGIKATQIEVENHLQKINNAKYPKEPYIAFSPEYCLSDDGLQNLLKAFNKEEVGEKVGDSSEKFVFYVILASNFQLDLLSQSKEWFLDGTFWSASKPFVPMVNIMIYSDRLGKYIPVVHLLLSGKSTKEYSAAFGTLVKVCAMKGYKLKPEFLMMDFEKSLQNACKERFSTAQILGCQFHFLKSLWRKAGKLGLKTKEKVLHTSRIICLLGVLVHIQADQRRKYYSDLQKHFIEDSGFTQFFTYFTKKWLNFDFTLNGASRLRNERTNNCCEAFHSYLSIFRLISL